MFESDWPEFRKYCVLLFGLCVTLSVFHIFKLCLLLCFFSSFFLDSNYHLGKFSINTKSFDSMITSTFKNYRSDGQIFKVFLSLTKSSECKMDHELSLILQNSLIRRITPCSVDVDFPQSIFADCTQTNNFPSFQLFRNIDLFYQLRRRSIKTKFNHKKPLYFGWFTHFHVDQVFIWDMSRFPEVARDKSIY